MCPDNGREGGSAQGPLRPHRGQTTATANRRLCGNSGRDATAFLLISGVQRIPAGCAYASPLHSSYWLMRPHRHRRSGEPRSPQQQRNTDNHVLESTSAKGKIRGTARQLVERYLQFAEEARLANDRVASEAFLQSAEHYLRLGNPVRHTDLRPVKHQPHAPAPTAAETCSSTGDTRITVPVAAVCNGQAPEPDAVLVKTEPNLHESRSREQAGNAKRAAAAADLERVAGQHGYTLAQLGLVLRS